jgi:predicted HTH transcriptional regulator
VALHEKLVSQISRGEINNLVKEGTPEDAFLEFREVLVDPKWSQEKIDDERESVVGDLTAFANAAGGLLIIGVAASQQERPERFASFPGDQAKKIADSLRDLAIQHIEPKIVGLESVDFQLDEEGAQWIVIARVPPSESRPHRTVYKDRAKRFLTRHQNRKREMTYDEIMRMFQQTPQQQAMARLLFEVESIRAEIEIIRARLEQ